MSVSISHPTDRPNFSIVTVGSLDLAFSYETVIGYRVGFGSWVVSENVWSKTTGKHLNYLTDKDRRIDHETFTDSLANVLKAHGL